MVLYPNKLPESERVCSGICTWTTQETKNSIILKQLLSSLDLISNINNQNR